MVQWTPFVQTFKNKKYQWVQLAGHSGNFKAGKSQVRTFLDHNLLSEIIELIGLCNIKNFTIILGHRIKKVMCARRTLLQAVQPD